MSRGRDTKLHIGIFGRRNAGKSSLINILAGQEIAIVSDVPGTTTDPVRKSMEVPGIGPVIFVDTAGIDDQGELGGKRVRKTLENIRTLDLAVLLISENIYGDEETALIQEFRRQSLPFLVIHNKSDLVAPDPVLLENLRSRWQVPVLTFSCKDPGDLNDLLADFREAMPESAWVKQALLGDLIRRGDVVLLITPIDTEAPEGRMILPQVQVIRDVLDHHGIVTACKETEAAEYIRRMSPKPVLAITDSQVFPKAHAAVPPDIMLTSFSILLARQKGDFEAFLRGTPCLGKLNDGDKILILESCTHHVTCDDIGRVKIPSWLGSFTGKNLEFTVIPGMGSLPETPGDFALVIQCGGCMLTRSQVRGRLRPFIEAGVPVTNYGMAIAWVHGIFERAIQPFVRLKEDNP